MCKSEVNSGVFCFPTNFSRQGLSLIRANGVDQAPWPANPGDALTPASPALGLHVHATSLGYYMGAGSHACRVSTLLKRSSPCPSVLHY